MNYAIKYVLGRDTRTMVLQASDSDDAFRRCRQNLRDAGFISASIQGSPRPASQDDIDAAEREARECSVCRRRHGFEVVHLCE